MNITIDIGFLHALWLVFCRISSFLLLTPLFAIAQVPVRVRIIFLLPLAFCFAMGLAQFNSSTISQTLLELVSAMTAEVITGLVMAFGVFAAFSTFTFAGRLLDFQIGFGAAGLIDPSSEEQAPLLGTILNMTAVLTFFLVDGHLLLLQSLEYSLEILPPGQFLRNVELEVIVRQFGLMFVFGLILVAPVIFTLLLVDIGMAIAARTMPQMNMFILSLPLKIMAGLIVFTLMLPMIKDVLERIFGEMFKYLQKLFLA